jgi:hypothetical protein
MCLSELFVTTTSVHGVTWQNERLCTAARQDYRQTATAAALFKTAQSFQ